MLLIMRVEMCSSSGTALGEISKLVNMNSMFLIRVESFDRACDFDGGVDVVLTERGKSSHVRLIRVEYTDGMSLGIRGFVIVEEEWCQ
jgi:hypothetical protein